MADCNVLRDGKVVANEIYCAQSHRAIPGAGGRGPCHVILCTGRLQTTKMVAATDPRAWGIIVERDADEVIVIRRALEEQGLHERFTVQHGSLLDFLAQYDGRIDSLWYDGHGGVTEDEARALAQQVRRLGIAYVAITLCCRIGVRGGKVSARTPMVDRYMTAGPQWYRDVDYANRDGMQLLAYSSVHLGEEIRNVRYCRPIGKDLWRVTWYGYPDGPYGAESTEQLMSVGVDPTQYTPAAKARARAALARADRAAKAGAAKAGARDTNAGHIRTGVPCRVRRDAERAERAGRIKRRIRDYRKAAMAAA